MDYRTYGSTYWRMFPPATTLHWDRAVTSCNKLLIKMNLPYWSWKYIVFVNIQRLWMLNESKTPFKSRKLSTKFVLSNWCQYWQKRYEISINVHIFFTDIGSRLLKRNCVFNLYDTNITLILDNPIGMTPPVTAATPRRSPFT